MEAQKTITIAYDVSPLRVSQILGDTYDEFQCISEFLSLSEQAQGRFVLAFEQFLKHAKQLDKMHYFLYDQSYNLFPNGSLIGSGGKINFSEIDIWAPQIRMTEEFIPMIDFP